MTTVDARGLACPLPLTMAKRGMTGLAPGERMVVLATDPEASIDLAAWAADAGHSLRETEREGFVEFELRKAAKKSTPGPTAGRESPTGGR